jgi:hypothetical protein
MERVDEGAPVQNNLAGVARYNVASPDKLTTGKHVLTFDFISDGGGAGQGGMGVLAVDGAKVEEGRIERTLGYRMSLVETLDIGQDTATPVTESYKVPFSFTGTLRKLTIELIK